MDSITSLNLFKFCSGLLVLGYLAILLVIAIVAISYYAVVVVTCGPQLARGGVGSVLYSSILVVFHFLLALLLWSYFMVVFRDPGSVPENWRPVLEENLELGISVALSDYVSSETSASTRNSSTGTERRQALSYCSHCENFKPPRCYHCSICKKCVLKMDHHCVWVVNCVGAQNYKFFLLFLLYTFMETTLDTLILMPHFIKFFEDAKNRSSSPSKHAITFLAFVLNLAFALSLLCFLVMHASLLSSNATTIEVNEKNRAARWKFDVGRRKNFEQVFGAKKAYWFLPLLSTEDLENIPALKGLDFPTCSDIEA
ncbi:putative protein S-acyltransferase 12 [Cinnamomum micranthum f. kanehirae]|uniref:S-acyltransferase n=1 Tax=Cinnamomum micranthum f. kanehirae TaxID=337451 RepID=A0A3S3MMC9_9MAGN|nr:putative protein S-acyltransferase 12 [Cinnamomum micranthum f. kanehirae]